MVYNPSSWQPMVKMIFCSICGAMVANDGKNQAQTLIISGVWGLGLGLGEGVK